jgi:general stress protein YciG
MPRGASPKRERQYEHIKQSAKKSGRYGGRAEEVAARTVNKIRREKGEIKTRRSGPKKSPTRASSGKSRATKPRATKAGATKSRTTRSRTRAHKSSSSNGRGFAGMSEQRQRAIAAEGGRAAHKQGTAHEFSRAEARQAGQKGGDAVSRDRRHMAEIGRRGGER